MRTLYRKQEATVKELDEVLAEEEARGLQEKKEAAKMNNEDKVRKKLEAEAEARQMREDPEAARI